MGTMKVGINNLVMKVQTLGLTHDQLALRALKNWKDITACMGAQSCPTLCDPMDSSPPGSSVHGIFQARILGRLPFPSPGVLSDPEIEPASPATPASAGRFFPTEPPGKPMALLAFPEGCSGSCYSEKEAQSPGRSWRRRCDGRESVRPHGHLLL